MTNSDSSSTSMTRLRNLVVVLVAVALSVSVFLGIQTKSTGTSLAALAEASVPLDLALTNGKPTLVEFYANWCTSCQAMAGDMGTLKQTYSDRLNFVMLNVDNTKWLPEMLHYQVDGIPHFVFLDPQGEAIASTIGEQPRPVMAANLDALIAGGPLPYLQGRGRVSDVETRTVAPSSNDDPRSHGSQVVSPT
ncbi:MAG: thioredoxin family protein [Synechococcales cyanobacterium K44_A2020_017]|nr:thioredoxin family protein [Synechococcales cyanobacterium K32_A2020_035]MBF2093723.1 thioredoxin family protein [Synechococcales cyanobacterium K44_A2020_017]